MHTTKQVMSVSAPQKKTAMRARTTKKTAMRVIVRHEKKKKACEGTPQIKVVRVSAPHNK